MQLREKLILELGVSDFDDTYQQKVTDEIIALALEKTFDELVKNTEPEVIEALQADLKEKLDSDFSGIQKKYASHVEHFYIIFNRNLNEIIGEFHT